MTDPEVITSLAKILPSDCVLGGETAAMLYGVDMRRQGQRNKRYKLCILRPRGSRSLRRPGIRSRSMRIHDDDILHHVSGMAITSPVRTVCDLAMESTIERATAWIEGFLRARLVTYKDLKEAARNRKGERGVRMLRRALNEADPASESPQETATRLRMLEAGLPRPVLQTPVSRGEGKTPYRIDLAWPRAGKHGGVGVEYYGEAFHPQKGKKAAYDRARLKALRRCGWIPLVITADDLKGSDPVIERKVAELLGKQQGTHYHVRSREPWVATRTNIYHNAWTRVREPWWRHENRAVGDVA